MTDEEVPSYVVDRRGSASAIQNQMLSGLSIFATLIAGMALAGAPRPGVDKSIPSAATRFDALIVRSTSATSSPPQIPHWAAGPQAVSLIGDRFNHVADCHVTNAAADTAQSAL
jgi:hypothetical protein